MADYERSHARAEATALAPLLSLLSNRTVKRSPVISTGNTLYGPWNWTLINSAARSYNLPDLFDKLTETMDIEGTDYGALIIRRKAAISRLDDFVLIPMRVLGRVIEATVAPTQEDEEYLQ